MTSDEDAARVAADAAERVILSRFDRSDLVDLDVTVQFRDGELTVDVFFETAPAVGIAEQDQRRVADEAVRAAGAAVDDLFTSPNG